MSINKVEAINLKIGGKECTGTFIFMSEEMPLSNIQVSRINKEVNLYFETSEEFLPEHHDAFYNSVHDCNHISVEHDGIEYKGLLLDWCIPNKGDHSGEIAMIGEFLIEHDCSFNPLHVSISI